MKHILKYQSKINNNSKPCQLLKFKFLPEEANVWLLPVQLQFYLFSPNSLERSKLQIKAREEQRVMPWDTQHLSLLDFAMDG